MKLQWFCSNIYANSGYSDEARVFLDSLSRKGLLVRVIGEDKKPGFELYEIRKKSDANIPIVYHAYRHGDYEPNDDQYSAVRTMLEVSRIPQSWVYRFNRMDEVWVPNRFNFDSFANSGVKKGKLFIIPSPVDLTHANHRKIFRINTGKKFRFLSLFSYEARDRKGLDVLLNAYVKTFKQEDDVCLVIKTKTSLKRLKKDYNLPRNIPEIKIIDRILERDDLLALYRAVDCYVLPSRGEGIGRTYLDAMIAGTPVIATGWSGNTDFLNEKNSYPVDFRLNEVQKRYYLKYPGFYGSRWAEPDEEDLIRKMKDVYSKRRRAKQKAERAKKDVREFDMDKVTGLVIKRLSKGAEKTVLKSEPASLFERLFPVYYPDIKKSDDIPERSRSDFRKKPESAAIIGSGNSYDRAFKYVYRKLGIKRICFLENELTQERILRFPSGEAAGIESIKDKADIIIIADSIPLS